MLQIRLLSKGSPADAGGGAKSPVETVTVACPDHLILADLPVAKSLGVVTASAPSSVRLSGRRSRRTPGEKVHICVRCDFPIAIYGRLTPCDHVFCLACARSESTCYLCDERIQKIQTIKMMEGIFICAAPHCLRSFLKRCEFESHISETHADHFVERGEGGNSEGEAINIPRPSSTDSHKQSLQPESSTARAPPPQRPQLQDREERTRRPQPPPRPPLQLRPENSNPWYQQQEKQPPLPLQPPSYNTSSGHAAAPGPSFSFPPFATDGSQPYYTCFETARPETERDSVLGIPPSPAAGPWGMMPFVNLQFPEGFGDPLPFFQGEQQNASLQAKESEQQGGGPTDHAGGKGMLALLPMRPPNNSSRFPSAQEGQVYGWQNDQRGFAGSGD